MAVNLVNLQQNLNDTLRMENNIYVTDQYGRNIQAVTHATDFTFNPQGLFYEWERAEIIGTELTTSNILFVAGFTREHANTIQRRDFGDWNRFLRETEEQIRALAKEYIGRAANNARIDFTSSMTNTLLALMHWVQDSDRMGLTPDDVTTFKIPDLDHALRNQTERASRITAHPTLSVAADPGPFTRSTNAHSWFPQFERFLALFSGKTEIPLTYLIRDSVEQTDDPDDDYLTRLHNMAPHSGPTYLTDNRMLCSILNGKFAGGPGESWIRNPEIAENGREAYFAVRNHYLGTSQINPRFHQAEKEFETLHYRSERTLPFRYFLTRMNDMLQIYAQCGDIWNDDRKLVWLLKKCAGAPHLVQCLPGIHKDRNKRDMTFQQAVSIITDDINRQIN
jgi:hypothetical protein